MKKVLIILLVLLISFVLIWGCTKQQVNCCKYGLGCPEKEIDKIVKNQDINSCKNIKPEAIGNPYYGNYCEAECISHIASLKEDPTLCELILVKNISEVKGWENPWETGSIKDYCYKELALKLNDSSLCKKVIASPQKEMCYTHLGLSPTIEINKE
ncbi:MAG: hypothetical protein WC413_03575 [Candidatus Nanoarchaeia archaeon]